VSNQSWGAQPSRDSAADSARNSETAEPELVEAELVEAETVETIIDVEVLDAEVFEDIQSGEVIPPPSPALGAVALGLAVVTAIVHIIAVVVSSASDFDLGTTLGSRRRTWRARRDS
jgi:hypothetical protein